MALQITGVTKDADGDILTLCGGGWSDSIEGVIADIKYGRYSYCVNVGGRLVGVEVVPATLHRKEHLRTLADSSLRNNLDYLPACN